MSDDRKTHIIANAPENAGVVPERLARAEELMAKTLNRRKAARKLSAEYEIALRTAKRYIGEVLKIWAAEAEHDDRTVDRDAIRNSTLSIYEEARAAGDRRAALAAIKLLIDLDGLGAEKHHVVIPMRNQPIDNDTDADDAAEGRLMLVAGGKDE